MAKYRAGAIGLGWMGMLYDLADRIWDPYTVDDADRPTPPLNVHRKFHYHENPGQAWVPKSYAEALWDRPEVDLVAGADRDEGRLAAFTERYGVEATYADAEAMLREQELDIVAVTTNVKGRSYLTCLAVEHGAKGVLVEKPMVHTLKEADRMVNACAKAGVALTGGSITTTHPSFATAKGLINSGAIGEVLSIEADAPSAQHQGWTYFLHSDPAWVIGTGDGERRESGSDEFIGQGMLVMDDETVVHFRKGGPQVRITGSAGEVLYLHSPMGWRIWQDVQTPARLRRVEMPWPDPQMSRPYGGVYALADIIDCIEGRLDEPKNSGRRVAMALEVEIALKQSSAQGGARVDLPLPDRSLGLNYEWFR